MLLTVPEFLFGQGYSLGPIQVQGSAGFSTELYGVQGIDARRPWGSGRIFSRITAEGLGFRYGLDLNLSTEQSSIRQNLNQVGLNASYGWLTVAAGDVRPVFSDYSLNGLVVRGSSVEARPGNWIFSTTGGRTQRTIRPTEDSPNLTPVFARWIYGARIGYNPTASNYLHVAGTYGRDASGSLDEGISRRFNLRPAENSTLSTAFGKAFFENRFNMDGTLTWSVHNGNFQSNPQQSTPGTGSVTPFVDQGLGTYSDYAGRIQFRYSESRYNVSTTYERVQPGFISMGLPFIRNDQEQIQVRPQVYFMNRRVRLGLEYLQARNNLSGQLLSTNYRNISGFNTQTRITGQLSLSGGYRLLLNRIVPQDDSSTVDMRQITHNINLTPTYNWVRGAISHNLQLSSNVQFFEMERNASDQTIRNDFTNLTTTINYTISLQSGLSISPGVTHLISRSDLNNLDAWRSQVSISKDFRDRLITMAVTGSYTNNRSSFGSEVDRSSVLSEQFSMNINAGYRLPFGDYLRLNLRGLRNSTNSGVSFSEIQGTLQLTHRF